MKKRVVLCVDDEPLILDSLEIQLKLRRVGIAD